MHHPVLKNGLWTEASFPVSSFKTVSPLTGKQLPDSFPVSSFLDLDEMLQSQHQDRSAIESISPQLISQLLGRIADGFAAESENLVETAHQETGLEKTPFLEKSELAVSIEYLKKAADLVSNQQATRTFFDETGNLHSFSRPLNGPVVLFSPAWSPFRLGSCTGVNFAAALAAGNSIIAKGNPGLPMTGYLAAKIVHQAISSLNLPLSLFQYFHHTSRDLGYHIAAHPMTGAVSFAGSQRSAKAIRENAAFTGKTFWCNPALANPVFIFPDCVEANREQLAREITRLALHNNGQNSCRPGPFFIVEDRPGSQLIHQVIDSFNQRDAKGMLSDIKARHLDETVAGLIRSGARKLTRKEFFQPSPFIYPNTVLVADARTCFKSPQQFHDHVPGPLALFITFEKAAELEMAVKSLDQCMSLSIFAGSHETPLLRQFMAQAAKKTSFLLFNRLPEVGPTGSPLDPFFANFPLERTIAGFSCELSFSGFPAQLLPESAG